MSIGIKNMLDQGMVLHQKPAQVPPIDSSTMAFNLTCSPKGPSNYKQEQERNQTLSLHITTIYHYCNDFFMVFYLSVRDGKIFLRQFTDSVLMCRAFQQHPLAGEKFYAQHQQRLIIVIIVIYMCMEI